MKASPYAFCSAGVSFKRCCSFSRSSRRSTWLFRSTNIAARRSRWVLISSGTCNHGAASQPQGPGGCSISGDYCGGWQRCVHYGWLHAGIAGHVREGFTMAHNQGSNPQFTLAVKSSRSSRDNRYGLYSPPSGLIFCANHSSSPGICSAKAANTACLSMLLVSDAAHKLTWWSKRCLGHSNELFRVGDCGNRQRHHETTHGRSIVC